MAALNIIPLHAQRKELTPEAAELRKIELLAEYDEIRRIEDESLRAVTAMEWVRGLNDLDAYLLGESLEDRKRARAAAAGRA